MTEEMCEHAQNDRILSHKTMQFFVPRVCYMKLHSYTVEEIIVNKFYVFKLARKFHMSHNVPIRMS